MRRSTAAPKKSTNPVIKLQSLSPEQKKKAMSRALTPPSNPIQLIITGMDTEEDMRYLVGLLVGNTTLKSLELYESAIDDVLFAILADSILHNQTLEQVILENVKMVYLQDGNIMPRLTQASFDLIMQLAGQKNLQLVHFKEHMLDNMQLLPLIQFLYSKKEKPTIKIDDAKEFTEAMALLELGLSTVAQPTFTIQRNWCSSALFPCLVEVFKPHLNIEILHCHGDRYEHSNPPDFSPLINDKQFLALLNVLEQQENIYYLNLSYNKLTNVCMKPLIEFLKRKRIIYLDISFNQFTDEAAVELSTFLESDAKLIWLNLAGNPIRNLGVAALAKGLGNNGALVTLKLNDCPIEQQVSLTS